MVCFFLKILGGRQELEQVGEEVQQEQDQRVSCKIGTMIELPRAAITADEIAGLRAAGVA